MGSCVQDPVSTWVKSGLGGAAPQKDGTRKLSKALPLHDLFLMHDRKDAFNTLAMNATRAHPGPS